MTDMSETKHTPGPWRALCLSKYTRVMRDRQPGRDETGSVQICHIAGPGDNDLRPFNGDRWEADARLIAAAPELLEALIAVRALIAEAAMTGFNPRDGDWAESLFNSQQASSSAIKKATGAVTSA